MKNMAPIRVRDTPISENAIIGAGIGAAVTGLRPVVELMFADFAAVTLDQIINQAGKFRYMSGGQLKVPLTIRAAQGWRRGFRVPAFPVLRNMVHAFPRPESRRSVQSG